MTGQSKHIISFFHHLAIYLSITDHHHMVELVVDDCPSECYSISPTVSLSLHCEIPHIFIRKFPNLFTPQKVSIDFLPVGDEVADDVPIGSALPQGLRVLDEDGINRILINHASYLIIIGCTRHFIKVALILLYFNFLESPPSVKVLFFCSFGNDLQQIRKMGQQCCSEQHVDNKIFSNSRESFYRRPSQQENHFQAINDNEYIRNFTPVERVPKLHPTVIEIENKLKPFTPSPDFPAPEGVTESKAYAINNEGLVYDAGSEWRDGLPFGRGRLIYKDGSLFTGYFSKGIPNGEGRFISSQGWYYEGDIQKEQAEGKGIFIFERLGYRYEGEWAADYPDGIGKETWVKAGNISTYEGEFVRGEKHGLGKYKCGDQWQYEGSFSNNEMTSFKGNIKYRNGEVYQGDFKDGKKHGFGIYKWTDGSVFEGWYSQDRKQGHGKFRSANNKIFQGQWKSGKREGRGVLIVGGKMYPGVWRNDLISSKTQL